MKSSYQFNEREFERLVATEVQSAVNDIAQQQTAELDQLRRLYSGHPVDEIKPVLQGLFYRHGGDVIDPELSEWAQLIADGTKIEMVPEQLDRTC